jgi:hypothetical protein
MARAGVRRRFWVESVLAAITGGLTILTLITREWIEAIFGVDPDGGNGSLEWLVVVVFGVAAVALTVAARMEWRRPLPA